MFCPRMYHYRRVDAMPDGATETAFNLCGNMTTHPRFDYLQEMEDSEWLSSIKSQMAAGEWPSECSRCKIVEEQGNKSIRQHALDRHAMLKKIREDYLIVGGVLDNVCNAACQFCFWERSTKIGSLLYGKDYVLINNEDKFSMFPRDRIVQLDITGGEPSYSKAYDRLLSDLPPNVKIVRINTNASKYMSRIHDLLDRNIKVIMTVSVDGIGEHYEHARWPLKWDTFSQNLDAYIKLSKSKSLFNLDTWTTISAYTIGSLPRLIDHMASIGVKHDMGYLTKPKVLDVRYSNWITRSAKAILPVELREHVASAEDNSADLLEYMEHQDKLRGTKFEDCYNRP